MQFPELSSLCNSRWSDTLAPPRSHGYRLNRNARLYIPEPCLPNVSYPEIGEGV